MATSIDTIEQILKQDLCIGCGVCASNVSAKMTFDKNGFYRPELVGKDFETVDSSLCPFSNLAKDESELGSELYSAECISYDEVIGWYDRLYCGAVSEKMSRLNSSSGGMTTWFAKRLFETDVITHFVGVGEVMEHGKYTYGYRIANSIAEVEKFQKTKYYPVEMSEVIDFILKNEGRYAVVGVPCFIKAVRLLAEKNELFKSRVVCCISIICGHQKSAFYYEMLLNQMDTKSSDISFFDFRKKFNNTNAHDYGVEVRNERGDVNSSKARELFGTNWGQCFLKYKACDFCDDVYGELADVVFGDAWVPEYSEDWKGNNIIICRNQKYSEMFNDGIDNGLLSLDKVDDSLILRSQDASIRHKRGSIHFRIYLLRVLRGVVLKKRSFPSATNPALIELTKSLQRMHLRSLSCRKYGLVHAGRISFKAFKTALSIRVSMWNFILRVMFHLKQFISRVVRSESI